MKGKLFIVATPIGNLSDITTRAVEILANADFVLCEDTRVTGILLGHLKLKKHLLNYFQHSSSQKYDEILNLLEQGKNLALVTDAGTPGISDPAGELVEFLLKSDKEIEIIPAPGASAVVAALSASGFPADKFIFLGFPPKKNKRKKFFEELVSSKYTAVIYESSHRIKKTLNEIGEVIDKDRKVCVFRELTKKFESSYRGTIQEILNQTIPEKGEFVIIVNRK